MINFAKENKKDMTIKEIQTRKKGRELEANGTSALFFRTDDFILRITVPEVTKMTEKANEKVSVNTGKIVEKHVELTERLTESNDGLIANQQKLIEKATTLGDKLTDNRIKILGFMIEDPYISKADLSRYVGVSVAAINSNIEVMRGKYLRCVGSDKGGFWEIIN